MNITITYETLFDLLRKERSLEELQPLAPDFWEQVVEYIKSREQHLTQTKTIEQEKGRIQLLNIKRIIKEIYERREQKIVRLALNVTRTKTSQYVDKRNMLDTEKALFDELVQLIKKYNQGVLLQVFNGREPLIAPVVLSDDDEEPSIAELPKSEPSIPAPSTDDSKDDETAEDDTPTADADDDEASEDGSPDESDDDSEERDDNSEQEEDDGKPEAKVSSIIVRFTTDVPKFVGLNKEIFGPYEKGKIAQLPAKIAQILLKKGKVKHVMGEE